MFTLNQTFTINMCVTHCNLKSISFSFSLILSFFIYMYMRNWKHHFSCCVFSSLFFCSFYYQFSNFILLCAFVNFILYTFLYIIFSIHARTDIWCCVFWCYTLPKVVSNAALFFVCFLLSLLFIRNSCSVLFCSQFVFFFLVSCFARRYCCCPFFPIVELGVGKKASE